MHSDWRCSDCGSVAPLHIAEHINQSITESVSQRIARGGSRMPLWSLWPLPTGWTVTGVAWVGDERGGVLGTAVACSGPGPLGDGPGDILLVAEEPGLGLGTRFAGIPGPDPGPFLADVMTEAPHAKVKAGGHPTPLWSVNSPKDRSAFAGEARGVWLYAVAWPAQAGYLLADDVVLHDLVEHTPSELVYGAPSPYLHGRA
ncbi:hypothetical protein GCM10010201_18600 [Pilimelia columellifera subsp. columellifera]|uniref:Uncharacterized protein n=2 Tax=Pilimelia TaxID=53370 RepID=A0ABP6AQZ3_9ACTN